MNKMDFLVNEVEFLTSVGTQLELSIDRLQEQRYEIARRIEENTQKRLKLVNGLLKKRKATVVTVGEINATH
jgi:hypothetical protein